jgi:hypothetical protein
LIYRYKLKNKKIDSAKFNLIKFNLIRQSYPYCIIIPLCNTNLDNNNTEPKYYARNIDSAYSYALNYAKRYINIEKNKTYYDDNGDIKYFINTKEEAIKTGKVWKYKINDNSYYYCDIIKKSITFEEEKDNIIFVNNKYREEIIKIYNFTLRKINNNIIYQDYKINANIYYDYINKCYGDYLSYNGGDEKYNTIEEVLTNYFTTCNLLLKNCDIIYNNIKNNPFTCLVKENFLNNKKIIFSEILIFTNNL